MVIYFGGIGKYKITSPWAVKSAPKGNPVLKKSKLHGYHSLPFSATQVTQQWAREKAQDGTLCVFRWNIYSLYNSYWLLKSSQKTKTEQSGGGISQRSQNSYWMVAAVCSGHRTAHQPFLPQSNQPLEPLLFCFCLLNEQLRDEGEKNKSRHNFNLYNIVITLKYVHETSVLRSPATYRGQNTDINTEVKVETSVFLKANMV